MATLSELEDRIKALEIRRPWGQFVSSLFGATYAPQPQQGFAAEITGSYNAEPGEFAGYPWQQLVTDNIYPGANPGIGQTPLRTGYNAYTPDGNTTLTAGTRGWMVLDPQASSWLFLVAGSSVETPCSPNTVFIGSETFFPTYPYWPIWALLTNVFNVFDCGLYLFIADVGLTAEPPTNTSVTNTWMTFSVNGATDMSANNPIFTVTPTQLNYNGNTPSPAVRLNVVGQITALLSLNTGDTVTIGWTQGFDGELPWNSPNITIGANFNVYQLCSSPCPSSGSGMSAMMAMRKVVPRQLKSGLLLPGFRDPLQKP